jgi:hypothetical protein
MSHMSSLFLQYDTQTLLVLLLFCIAIENTVKQPSTCLQNDTQTVLFLLLLCIAIENMVKQPFSRQEQFESHIEDNWTVALPYFQ